MQSNSNLLQSPHAGQTPKPSRPPKNATDILVPDPDAALRKFQTVTRAILNVPKAEVVEIRENGKNPR